MTILKLTYVGSWDITKLKQKMMWTVCCLRETGLVAAENLQRMEVAETWETGE